MADERDKRRDDERLDASLSVLGEGEGEASIGRVGGAPRPAANSNLAEALDHTDAGKDGGNHDPLSERAAKDAIRDTTNDLPKR